MRHIIHVDFPALDSLVEFLKAKQQAEIDAATAAITGVTAQLKKSSDTLNQKIQAEQNT